jgi:hypothetical protein
MAQGPLVERPLVQGHDDAKLRTQNAVGFDPFLAFRQFARRNLPGLGPRLRLLDHLDPLDLSRPLTPR